jgi:hypothetical protein
VVAVSEVAVQRTIEDERERLSLLVKIASGAGDFSPKLADAVAAATDPEVRVMSDLIEQGLSIPGLVGLLQGAHILVGDDGLYEAWIFPRSRRRMSSHHRNVDKALTPDYGVDGPLVREALHGKAVVGTWIQLERTKATFRWGSLPTWSDVVHIRDYILYRITGKNVGPWGLSAHVDTRPVLLRPPHATRGRAAGRGLSVFARRRARFDLSTEDTTGWTDVLSPDVEPVGPAGDLFGAPSPEHPEDLLPDAPYKDELGDSLFGSLPMVRAETTLREGVCAILDAAEPQVVTEAPDGRSESITLAVGATRLRVRAAVLESTGHQVFIGIEEEQ